jgi:hypothetical protein
MEDAWWRPTWLTAGVVGLPVALGALAVLLGWDTAVFALWVLLVELPFGRYRALGLPVGRRGDWFGFAFPNGLGWTLIAVTDVAGLYLLGCLASAAWRRLRRRARRPG